MWQPKLTLAHQPGQADHARRRQRYLHLHLAALCFASIRDPPRANTSERFGATSNDDILYMQGTLTAVTAQ
jgi:hypothetical protein